MIRYNMIQPCTTISSHFFQNLAVFWFDFHIFHLFYVEVDRQLTFMAQKTMIKAMCS
jgi:hypothetical protein